MRMVITLFAIVLGLAVPAAATVRFPDETFAFDADHPAAGHWIGEVSPPTGQGAFIAMFLVNDGDAWSAETTFLASMSLHAECRNVIVGDRGRHVAFDLPVGSGALHVEGTVSEDGQHFRGTMIKQFEGIDPGAPQPIEMTRTPRPDDLPEPLAYSGTISIQGMGDLAMTIVLAETPGGHLVGHVDVPAQMLKSFPLVHITRADGLVRATLPVIAPATFELTMSPDRSRLKGTMNQGPFTLDLDFLRDEGYVYHEIPRPQLPVAPFPYEQRQIEAEHPDGFTITGTLTVPKRDSSRQAPFPCAVLISGSGQQDRDESILGHKPFLVLADYLSRHGIAVMRYDDRGVGGSGGIDTLENATSADFATDVAAVVDRIRHEQDIDPSKIGLIGHSEGGMIAPMLGSPKDGIAFMVLLAGPGVAGKDLLGLQLKLATTATGGDPDDAEVFRMAYAGAIDHVLAGDDAAARQALARAGTARMRASGLEPTDDLVEQFVNGQMAFLDVTWVRYFLAYDPVPALRRVTCPVLALNGTLDLQVWHEQNLDAIEREMSAAGCDITARRYPGLNHLFQPATTGSISEYAQIETTFDEQVMRDIVEWIRLKLRSDHADIQGRPEGRVGRKVIK